MCNIFEELKFCAMKRFHTNKSFLFPLILIFFFSSYTTDNKKVPGCTGTSREANSPDYAFATTKPVKASVSSIGELIRFSEKIPALHVTDIQRGGDFVLVHNVEMQNDNGLVFPADAFGTGWHWVREVKKDEPTNLKWFGAKGLGIDTYKEDSAALVNAIKSITQKNGGKLYIPASTSYYGFNGDGIVLPDNIEIYGDGPKSEIKHINPASGTYYRGVIFFTTTYGNSASKGVVRIPSYPLFETPAKQKYVLLKKAADAANFNTGTLIGLGGKLFFKNQDPKQPRYGQFEINEIVDIKGDTIFLKYPTTTSFQGNKKKPPVIIDVNGKHSYAKKLNAARGTNFDDRITRNIYIHDLKLSQAEKNLINNTPYSDPAPPFNLIALGGTFESKFENLILEGFGTFGGNMWNRCEVSNLQIISSKKLFDLGAGSANTVIHDVKWSFKQSQADTAIRSLIYLNEGSHHIEIYNVEADGDWSGQHLIQIGEGANNLYLHDIVLNIPGYKAPSNYGIFIRDQDNNVNVYNVTLKNITVKLGVIAQYIRLAGQPSDNSARNIVLENINFEGKTSRPKGYSVYVSDFGNIRFQNVAIPEGNIYFSKLQKGVVDGLKAPNSILICPDKSDIAPKILNATVKASAAKEIK